MVLTEQELFQKGYEEPVSMLIKANARKKYGKGNPDDVSFDESSELSITDEFMGTNGNCGVPKGGVTWTFDSFEVGNPVVSGVEVTVPWAELKPYLNRAVL